MFKKLMLVSLLLFSAAGSAENSVLTVDLTDPPYERSAAREQAMVQVLARLTGSQAANSWVQDEALAEIDRYLVSESFAGGYQATFDETQLSELLNTAQLTFSVAPKPSLLMWQQLEGKGLMAEPSWQSAAKYYQWPLLWPVWDLDEYMLLSDAEAFTADNLQTASQAYGADYWLALTQHKGQGRWQFFSAKQTQPLVSGKFTAPMTPNDISQLMAKLNDAWLKQPQVKTKKSHPRLENSAPDQPLTLSKDEPGELTILVSGLTRFSDTILLERRLSELAEVNQVQVIESAGYQSRYRLAYTGAKSTVLNALSNVEDLAAQGTREFNWLGSQRD